jgi:hypothetical protein
MVDYLAKAGGLFALFTFVHFVVDWVFQSHAEAMAKHNTPKVRARHCAIYTVPFLPILWALGLTGWEIVASTVILFGSHFVEDTYLPVLLWCKYVRRPPSMGWRIEKVRGTPYMSGPTEFIGAMPVRSELSLETQPDWRTDLFISASSGKTTYEAAQKELDRRGFLEFIETTLGKILMIAIDQIIHLVFLWPVVWMALN